MPMTRAPIINSYLKCCFMTHRAVLLVERPTQRDQAPTP